MNPAAETIISEPFAAFPHNNERGMIPVAEILISPGEEIIRAED